MMMSSPACWNPAELVPQAARAVRPRNVGVDEVSAVRVSAGDTADDVLVGGQLVGLGGRQVGSEKPLKLYV